MHYFFVTIQYIYNEKKVTFSTVIKSRVYPKNLEIIETAFLKDRKAHMYLGYKEMFDTIHDPTTKIISYSNLTEEQYYQYKSK